MTRIVAGIVLGWLIIIVELVSPTSSLVVNAGSNIRRDLSNDNQNNSVNSRIVLGSNGAHVIVNMTSGAASIFLSDNNNDDENDKENDNDNENDVDVDVDVDAEPWFQLLGGMTVVGGGEMRLLSPAIQQERNDPHWGPYIQVSWKWSTNDEMTHVIETSYSIFSHVELILFKQFFHKPWNRPKEPDFKLPTIVASFPTVDLTSLPTSTSSNDNDDNSNKTTLHYLTWGDCFLSDTRAGDWGQVENYKELFNGDTYGQPWVVHNTQGRTAVWSSASNYFVSGFAVEEETNTTLQVGLRTTLKSIPSNFRHTSVFVAGSGINTTLMEWGDVLLQLGSGKDRAHVYDDFLLAHLGYWTDNGAYHYRGAHDGYPDMQTALIDIKQGLQESGIPIRYIQWDDWWMQSKGDIPGMLSWEPKPDVFPAGFSDWLGIPLAMYAPEYSGENVWIHDYTWKVVQVPRGLTAIPLDPNFYMDLFRNGTKIGMIMFEQDFLCSYGIGDSGLTNTDVHSGHTWLRYMDDAAMEYGIKLQFCMPDAYHLLESTNIVSVTNARATDDNTRQYKSILSMGQNGLLFYALGVFASRDNVWTSNANVEQMGCGNFKETEFCYETNAHLDNAVAVLSNGPYGIADALGYTNKTLVMYACRSDGKMLRPRWPMASLDFTFTMADAKQSLVWAAHDDFGSYRWSYIIGVDLRNQILITPSRLIQGSMDSYPSTMVAWQVNVGQPVTNLTLFTESSPFRLPKSPPLNLPYDINAASHTHYATAPVLPNGMVFLGEYQKWATMSFGRIVSLEATESAITVQILGTPLETVKFAYLTRIPDDMTEDVPLSVLVGTVTCTFPSPCHDVDTHGNRYCRLWIVCQTSNGCDCSNNVDRLAKEKKETLVDQ